MWLFMKYLLVAAFSAFLYSLYTIMLKKLVFEVPLHLLIISPLFIFISIVFAGGSFVLFQISIKKEKASHVWLINTLVGTLVILLASLIILKEGLFISEMIGFLLMLIAALILIKKAR